MAVVRVAINGFGRIGRLAFRQMFGAKGYKVVAINDLTTPKMLAHLLKYDTAHRSYDHEVTYDENSITVDGKKITIYAEKDAKDLPWKNIARVQLWPEKCMILYYAPSWWMRIAAVCTPFIWDDVMAVTREKLGRKRKIRLPASLVIPAEQRTRRAAPRPSFEPEPEETPGQLSLFDETPDDVPQD